MDGRKWLVAAIGAESVGIGCGDGELVSGRVDGDVPEVVDGG